MPPLDASQEEIDDCFDTVAASSSALFRVQPDQEEKTVFLLGTANRKAEKDESEEHETLHKLVLDKDGNLPNCTPFVSQQIKAMVLNAYGNLSSNIVTALSHGHDVVDRNRRGALRSHCEAVLQKRHPRLLDRPLNLTMRRTINHNQNHEKTQPNESRLPGESNKQYVQRIMRGSGTWWRSECWSPNWMSKGNPSAVRDRSHTKPRTTRKIWAKYPWLNRKN